VYQLHNPAKSLDSYKYLNVIIAIKLGTGMTRVLGWYLFTAF
jgi:hypothetical protein